MASDKTDRELLVNQWLEHPLTMEFIRRVKAESNLITDTVMSGQLFRKDDPNFIALIESVGSYTALNGTLNKVLDDMKEEIEIDA